MREVEVKVKARVPEELYAKFRDQLDKEGLTIKEFVINAIRDYVEAGKRGEEVSLREIVLRFQTKCRNCGRILRVGERAFWAKGWGVMCMDCYIDSMGDKALARRYMKIRELERIKKALQEDVERLAQLYEEYMVFGKLDKVAQHLGDMINRLRDLVLGGALPQEIQDQLNKIYYQLEDIRLLLKAKR